MIIILVPSATVLPGTIFLPPQVMDLFYRQTTKQEKSNYPGWDFENVWDIDPEGIINDGYPYLRQ